MYKKYLYLALALLLALPLRAELTVVVAVNGLDETALKELQPFWPQGGLRLLSEEAYQSSVTYDHWLYGGDEALATLLTGVQPAEHGICSNYCFSRETRVAENVFVGNQRLAIGCSLGYSPAALLSPTITDRLRLRYGADSHIYAIGIEPATTILLAGHAANACCWIDSSATSSPRWVSTSFYREGLPSVADEQNVSGTLAEIMSRSWSPRMRTNTYLHPTDEEKKHGFHYRLNDCPIHRFSQSNSAVVVLALALQQDQQLGKNAAPDVLLLQLTALTPKAHQSALASAEQEDMYLHLNQDLGFLIEQLQKRIGRDQLRVVVMGLPRLGVDLTRMSEYNMPIGVLSTDRVAALTSTYLMALYGHERWVDGGCGHSLYLNRALIEQKQLDIATIRRQVAEFLMEFEGIRYACPTSEAYLHSTMAPSLHKRFVGDVVFELQPNYTLDATPYPLPSTPYPLPSTPSTYYRSPVLIWSGEKKSVPLLLKAATEVADYIL